MLTYQQGPLTSVSVHYHKKILINQSVNRINNLFFKITVFNYRFLRHMFAQKRINIVGGIRCQKAWLTNFMWKTARRSFCWFIRVPPWRNTDASIISIKTYKHINIKQDKITSRIWTTVLNIPNVVSYKLSKSSSAVVSLISAPWITLRHSEWVQPQVKWISATLLLLLMEHVQHCGQSHKRQFSSALDIYVPASGDFAIGPTLYDLVSSFLTSLCKWHNDIIRVACCIKLFFRFDREQYILRLLLLRTLKCTIWAWYIARTQITEHFSDTNVMLHTVASCFERNYRWDIFAFILNHWRVVRRSMAENSINRAIWTRAKISTPKLIYSTYSATLYIITPCGGLNSHVAECRNKRRSLG